MYVWQQAYDLKINRREEGGGEGRGVGQPTGSVKC